MTVARRRFLRAVAVSIPAGGAAFAQERPISIDILRGAASLHGISLQDGRYEVIQRAMERRFHHLQLIRDFPMPDDVEPAILFSAR